MGFSFEPSGSKSRVTMAKNRVQSSLMNTDSKSNLLEVQVSAKPVLKCPLHCDLMGVNVTRVPHLRLVTFLRQYASFVTLQMVRNGLIFSAPHPMHTPACPRTACA